MSQVEQVPAASWQTWVEQNEATILDVREPHEWALGTLPGARKIRIGELVSRMGELPKDRPILVVCRSGHRSQQVAMYLAIQGHVPANMAGGMVALGMQT